jgi:type II secretory pathway predicted ATPase ExeA
MVGGRVRHRTQGRPEDELLITLEALLTSNAAQDKRCLLIVDEAQNLTPQAVEELRMLSTSSWARTRCCRASSWASRSSA